jgi:hypothetical protein
MPRLDMESARTWHSKDALVSSKSFASTDGTPTLTFGYESSLAYPQTPASGQQSSYHGSPIIEVEVERVVN